MLIDAFCYCGEESVLEIRFRELDSIVDRFVLVEAELTQSLKPKPLYFQENKDRFMPWLHKVEHVIIRAHECPDNSFNAWEMENFTRNCITRGLDVIPDIKDEDIIMIGDCDEVPDAGQLRKLLYDQKTSAVSLDVPIALGMEFCCYFLNLHASDKGWVGTVCAPKYVVDRLLPQGIRSNKDYYDRMENAGWHFSYVRDNGWEGVWQKYSQTIEPLNKGCLEKIKENFKDLFLDHVIRSKRFLYADRPSDRTVVLKELDFERLPICVQEDKNRFSSLLFREEMII